MIRTAVSLVDGFNIPIRVDNDKGCSVADCPVDLNPTCVSPSPSPPRNIQITDAIIL